MRKEGKSKGMGICFGLKPPNENILATVVPGGGNGRGRGGRRGKGSVGNLEFRHLLLRNLTTACSCRTEYFWQCTPSS